MTSPPTAETLTSPLRTDADVLARIEQLIAPADRVRQSLWLFFLDQDQAQLPVVMPIADVPDDPDPELVGNLCWTIAEALGGSGPAGSVVITLTHPGPASPGDADRTWHTRLRDGAAAHDAHVRMMCLATPEGVAPLSLSSATGAVFCEPKPRSAYDERNAASTPASPARTPASPARPSAPTVSRGTGSRTQAASTGTAPT
jgi:hypothetical protein